MADYVMDLPLSIPVFYLWPLKKEPVKTRSV
ncbi:hypothetical protein predicted by Glimmer/Critica [Acetobacter ghanensis]|uniref:Uncharacterized protein n=1 Tax=Acetobacter ghanensis TaxID=431306 RepID=A0A0U5F0S1_9PROT|nr:hypothetical protein predicted by Glimmer/Critica [Acetobacter ghanensis]